MDGEKLKKALEEMMDKAGHEGDKRPVSDLSFLPRKLQGRGLKLTSSELTKVLPTFIVGTISQVYTEDMWKADVAEVGKHFNLAIDDTTQVFQIKMIPQQNAPDKMDANNAIDQIEQALVKINTGVTCIRVVRIGVSGTKFEFEAVSYLLKEWKLPLGHLTKQMQYVTAGDTINNELLVFCKSLCISGICPEIEFYNTHDYHPFGIFNSQWYRP